MAKTPERNSLLSIIEEAAKSSRQGAKCSVGLLLKQFDEQDRTDLEQAIANDSIPGAIIARTLRGLGYRCPDDAVLRHRRKACACESR